MQPNKRHRGNCRPSNVRDYMVTVNTGSYDHVNANCMRWQLRDYIQYGLSPSGQAPRPLPHNLASLQYFLHHSADKDNNILCPNLKSISCSPCAQTRRVSVKHDSVVRVSGPRLQHDTATTKSSVVVINDQVRFLRVAKSLA